jgi:tripartite-type tricarboxylate transporter receptor subunit TctC
MNRTVALLGAACCMLLNIVPQASAQDYPTRPVRMIVPYPAGGGADVIGRTLAQKLTEAFGQQVIVDDRPGGASNIGTEAVARAAPDGYTLLICGTNHASNVSLFRKIAYDPIKDFAPISLLTSASYVLDVHPSLPALSVKELVTLARAKPGQINYGSGGNGLASHLGMELFKIQAKIDMQHVPYKGGPPMLTDLLGGQISVGYDNIITSVPYIRAGRLRALAVSGARRSPLLPELPTMAESGLPGYDVSIWQGLLAPAGTPERVLKRLQDDTIAGMRKPDTMERIAALGADVVASSGQEFGKFLKSEIDKWGAVIRATGARLD